MKIMSLTRFACVVLLGLVCFVSAAMGQTETATVSGLITDETGAAVPGAEVKLQSVDRGTVATTTTNDAGIYVFASVHPGQYQATVDKPGFKQVDLLGMIVNVQDHIEQNFRLQVGSVAESVTVEARASLLNTQDATLSTVVDREFVENMPLNGRSFQTLITLTPGTVLTKANANEQGQFSIDGQRANANYFTVDGVSANIGVSAGGPLFQTGGGALPGFNVNGGTNSLVSVDALQEFRIQTSTFAPEYGRSPGGQISILTRSGTNDFHGTLFEYFRNDVLDANNWFANQRGLPKPQERQNDFGGVVGGPIIRKRTFFFFSYEGLRLRQPQTVVTIVPSADTRKNAPPSLQPFLNAYTVPNGAVFSDGFAESAASYSDPSSLNATSIRLDHNVGNKLTLFGRYNYSPSEGEQRGFNGTSLSSISNVKLNTQTLTLGGTVSITPQIGNDIRLNYSRNEAKNFVTLDNFAGAVRPPDSVLFPPFASSLNSNLQFFIIGGTTLGVGQNTRNVQRQFNLVDNVSIAKGKHQLKFGADYRWLSPISRASDYEAPFFFGITGPGSILSGAPFFTTVGAFDQVTLGIKNFSAYAQDTWRVSHRLTLTYGVRWEVNPAPYGRDGKNLYTLQDPNNVTTLTLAPAGTPLYETTYTNVAPRVGLAWQLSQKSGMETVLRGGFGIFYDLGTGSLGDAPSFFPNGRTVNAFGSFPLTPSQSAPPPFSLVPQSGDRLDIAEKNLSLPRTYQWNVTLQQSIGSSAAGSVSYVGAVGRDLLRRELLVSPNFFQVALTKNEATSDYHALQFEFQRRLSRGLQALASYTFAHSIDIASNDSAFNTAGGFVNPSVDRGPSDFDVRHTFSGAVTYELPNPHLGLIGKVFLNKWAVDAFGFARSATPVDLVGGFHFAPGGFSSQPRPDVVLGVPFYLYGSQYPGGKSFNPAAFVPPAGLQGTLGRNALRGFGAWQADLALRREFALGERLKLQFRTEFFNIFNHPNFGDPCCLQSNFISNPTFGRSPSTLAGSLGSGGVNGGFNPLYQVGGPRSIQFALKLQF
jgi:hypothetical protein